MELTELKKNAQEKMDELKDFQRATVDRIDALFRSGQHRVLVADEVGLGKTLIAKGAIAKCAVMQHETGDDLFKIVYICSNQVIANQNMRKLGVTDTESGVVGSSRLSMQHLRIAQQEQMDKQKNRFFQLISLTPGTSFNITARQGTQSERALIYVILSRIPELQPYLSDLSLYLSWKVMEWDQRVADFEREVQKLESSGTGYPANILEEMKKNSSYTSNIEALCQHLDAYRRAETTLRPDMVLISRLRQMFAEVSIEMLHPDLVIMDEFQRFQNLIDPQVQETESGLIAKKFFETKDLKVLLLSATPYRLYSTAEEIEEEQDGLDAWEELKKVMDFLLHGGDSMDRFTKVWSDYSHALHEATQGDTAVLRLKQAAEDEMYSVMSRTERISVMDTGDYLDDSSVHSHLRISPGDILTYVEMDRVLREIESGRSILVDYAKSSPYLMSFMDNYKVKTHVEEIIRKRPEMAHKLQSDYLWIDREWMEHYGKIPSNSARLDELKRQIFRNRSELYLWVPPSRPYYPLEGVYKDSRGFSKILVFSSWAMVPRMIGTMISYEEERRTVGVLARNENIKSEHNGYFEDAKVRYPAERLTFRVSNGEAQGMYLFCLIYPSRVLSEIYSPLYFFSRGYTLRKIREELVHAIARKLSPILERYQQRGAATDRRTDRRWYYMAPMLLDGAEYVSAWIGDIWKYAGEDDAKETAETRGFSTHLDRLKILLENAEAELGAVPDDLSNVLADMTIGSFAVCAYRSNGGSGRRATALARQLIRRFNGTEATAAVILAYGGEEDFAGDGHWRNVLRYCCDGGFGAMLDEYIHMMSGGKGFSGTEEENERIHRQMLSALRIHTASYQIDSFPVFQKRMCGEDDQKISMRTHYAVAFSGTAKNEDERADRKENIRNAFNSPLWPFVLGTTSIGQEGLDFHVYCRKIMHWNLPGNPIDIEQREGRINRYKCLAIRQDLAERFGDREFHDDVWQELFEMAEREIRTPEQSDLVPYWCLGKDQKVKIERIVPMFPLSRDGSNYERLMKVLSVYRLTMGQARQEELVDYFLRSEISDREYIRQLTINLSPYARKSDAWKTEMRTRHLDAGSKEHQDDTDAPGITDTEAREA